MLKEGLNKDDNVKLVRGIGQLTAVTQKKFKALKKILTEVTDEQRN